MGFGGKKKKLKQIRAERQGKRVDRVDRVNSNLVYILDFIGEFGSEAVLSVLLINLFFLSKYG